MTERQGTQSAKFKDAARETERNEDEARLTDRLKNLTRQAPST